MESTLHAILYKILLKSCVCKTIGRHLYCNWIEIKLIQFDMYSFEFLWYVHALYVDMPHGPFITDLYHCDSHQREENKVCHAGALCLSPLTAAHGGNGTLLSLSGCAQTLSLISSALGLFTRKTVRCRLEYDTKILLLGRFSTRFFCSVCQNAWTNLTTMASLRMFAKLRAGVVGCTEPFLYALKTTRSPVKLLHTVNWNYGVGVVRCSKSL